MPNFAPTPEMKSLLKRVGTGSFTQQVTASAEVAKAIELPLRQGILDGDTIGGLFEVIRLDEGTTPEFPLHFLAPGTEKNFVSYVIPNHGYIPERHVEGDYVMVPVYDIGNSIDSNLRYARDARWDIMSSMMEVLRNGFVQKMNDDGWQTILAAGVDRNIVVYDDAANSGQFTKRLVSLSKTIMRRNGGGNSSSMNRSRLTDLYLSPEGLEDIRNWGVDQVDEITRREIYVAADGTVNRVFSVNLHDMDEFGEGQSYQLFYSNTLSGQLPTGDVEIGIGLDLSKSGAFIMPMRGDVEIFVDEALHRKQRFGWYGWLTGVGFACLDSRRVIVVSY